MHPLKRVHPLLFSIGCELNNGAIRKTGRRLNAEFINLASFLLAGIAKDELENKAHQCAHSAALICVKLETHHRVYLSLVDKEKRLDGRDFKVVGKCDVAHQGWIFDGLNAKVPEFSGVDKSCCATIGLNRLRR